MENIFLTVQEIAKILKINPLTVYEYIRTGKLTPVKLGRTYRITQNDFEKFIEQNKVINDS